jgi:hypothetical protein
MDRKQLESAAARYPYFHSQGLYAIPAGILWFLIGLSNLEDRPVSPWVLFAGAVGCLAALGGVGLYYRRTYGKVNPTADRRRRYIAGAVAGFGVFVAVDQLIRTLFGRPPTPAISSYVTAWSLGMLVFYAIAVGLKVHHIVVWGTLAVAGILPVWGVSADRDALASFPIGVVTMLSGLLDHRLLLGAFASAGPLDLETSHARGQ